MATAARATGPTRPPVSSSANLLHAALYARVENKQFVSWVVHQSYGSIEQLIDLLTFCTIVHNRQRINSLANSESPLKWTVDRISVYFNGLKLLAVDLSPRRAKSISARSESKYCQKSIANFKVCR
jgi:hypothetical protein